MAYVFQKKWRIGIIIVCCAILIFSGLTVFSQTTLSLPSGYQTGVTSTTNIGNGADKTPDGLRQSTGFYDGVGAGYMIGEEGLISPTMIYEEVETLSGISSLLKVDVEGFLNQKGNRSDALNVIIQELQYQQDIVDEKLQMLNTHHTMFQASYQDAQKEQENLQNAVLNAIDSKYAFEAEDNLKKFLSVKIETGTLFTRMKVIEILQEKYTIAKNLLAEKLTFLNANRNALIKGVQVVDIEDPDIQLIITKEEWEKNMQ